MPRDKIGHFYYSWYPTIYQADTQALTLAEDGAYRRLIDHYMLTRAPLLDDDRALARIIGIGIDEWDSIKNRIKTYFKPSGNPAGYLMHDFCEEALAVHNSRIDKARNNGKKGGRPKSLNIKENNPAGSESLTQRKAITEHNITEQKEKDDVVNDAPFTKIYDFGSKLFPRLAIKNTSEITKWVDAGYDVTLDILPVISQSQGRDIASWKYFSRMIVQANADRLTPLPQPMKGKQNGKFDNRDPATRARDIGEEIIRKRNAEWERQDRAAALAVVTDQSKP